MAVAVNELVTRFSFQGNVDPLEGFNKSLGDSITFLAGLGAALAGMSAIFGGFVISTSASLAPLNRYSEATGVAIGDLQALGFAAKQTGSSQEELNDSLEEFAGRIGETAATGAGAAKEAYDILGLSIYDAGGKVKDTETLLAEVSNRFAKGDLTEERKTFFVEELGFHREMIPLLNKGADGMKALTDKAKLLGVVSEEDGKKFKELNASLGVLDFGFSSIKNTIAVNFAPQLTELAKSFTDLLIDNKKFITEGIMSTVKFIGELGKALVRLTPFIGIMAAGFVAWKVAAVGLNFALLANPVFWIVGALVGLAIVVDDLVVAFKGGNSVIADWFKELTGHDIQPFLKDLTNLADLVGGVLVDSFNLAFTAIKGVVNIWGKLLQGDGKGANDELKKTLGKTGELIKNIFKGVFDSLALMFKGIFEAPSFDEITTDLKKMLTDLKPDWWGADEKEKRIVNQSHVKNKGTSVRTVVRPENQSSTPFLNDNDIIQKAAPQSNISNSTNTVNQNISMTVSASQEPRETGLGIQEGLKAQVKEIKIHASMKDAR